MTALALSPATRAGEAPTMPAIHAALGAFDAISLDHLHDAALLERLDRKFVVDARLIAELLAAAAPHYRALEIRGTRVFQYVTQYLDTPELALYHAHHSGRRPRAKVRVREYRDTGDRFLELKQRTNAGTTVKSRLLLNGHPGLPVASLRDRTTIAVPELDAPLRETVRVSYSRITLVHRANAERVTIDLGLVLEADGRRVEFPHLAFVEVKQARRGPSPVVTVLREHGLREREVSKYCLGVVHLIAEARTHRFRRRYANLRPAGERS